MILADTISLGLLIGLPAALLLLVVLIVAAAAAAYWRRREVESSYGDEWMPRVVFWVAVVASCLTVVAIVVGTYPFKHSYHWYVEKGGVVQEVSKRLVSDGDNGMQEKIVVKVDGTAYGILDTRAALVKVGDRVDIACKRVYEWGSKDNGYDCRWNGMVQR